MRLTDAEQWILPFIGVGQKNATRREYLSAISGLDDRTMRQGNRAAASGVADCKSAKWSRLLS